MATVHAMIVLSCPQCDHEFARYLDRVVDPPVHDRCPNDDYTMYSGEVPRITVSVLFEACDVTVVATE